jgi:hypothetical protein
VTPLQVLAFCGLFSAALGTVGGLFGILPLVGLGSLIMLSGNLYAFIKDS